MCPLLTPGEQPGVPFLEVFFWLRCILSNQITPTSSHRSLIIRWLNRPGSKRSPLIPFSANGRYGCTVFAWVQRIREDIARKLKTSIPEVQYIGSRGREPMKTAMEQVVKGSTTACAYSTLEAMGMENGNGNGRCRHRRSRRRRQILRENINGTPQPIKEIEEEERGV